MINNDNIRLPEIRILSNQGETMKIKELDINGIGGIQKLHLTFNENFNVICGSNGVGKTTILNIISNSFGTYSQLKRKSNVPLGNYEIKITSSQNQEFFSHMDIDNFDPQNLSYPNNFSTFSKDLLSFGINRDIQYASLSSIQRDPNRDIGMSSDLALNNISSDDVKNWFANRFLFSNHKDSLPLTHIEDHLLAQRAFSVLDQKVKFKTVLSNSFDILLTTDNGDLYFEYLSSGYKSCIYIIFGIIKEIEYRFIEEKIAAKDFDGVILIDEIDLHLHPTWQAQLIHALKEIFPVAQFIVTTHSPSVLQSLRKEEIMALTKNDVGDTIIKELNIGKYGLQGWSLEEILRDVMEMTNTSSNFYKETLDRYDQAMNEDNGEEVLKQYHILMEMLHPANPLRKLLGLQVAEWEE